MWWGQTSHKLPSGSSAPRRLGREAGWALGSYRMSQAKWRRQRTRQGGARTREATGGMKACGAPGRAGWELQLLRVSLTDAQPRGACDLPQLPAPWPSSLWDTDGPQTGSSHPLLFQKGDSVEPWDGEAGGSLPLPSLPHGLRAAGWGQLLTCRTGVGRRWAGTHGPQPPGSGGWGTRRYFRGSGSSQQEALKSPSGDLGQQDPEVPRQGPAECPQVGASTSQPPALQGVTVIKVIKAK